MPAQNIREHEEEEKWSQPHNKTEEGPFDLSPLFLHKNLRVQMDQMSDGETDVYDEIDAMGIERVKIQMVGFQGAFQDDEKIECHHQTYKN